MPTNVEVTGYHLDGTSVSRTFTLDGTNDSAGPLPDFETFQLGSSFTNLTSVEVSAGRFALDNVRVLVRLTNQPPTVSLLAPPRGAIFSEGDSITLEADAADSDGQVVQVDFFDFYFRSNLLASVTQAPFRVTLTNVPYGTYGIAARATDDRGETSFSSAVRFQVQAFPRVTISEPTNGAIFAYPATIHVEAGARAVIENLTTLEILEGSNVLYSISQLPASTMNATFDWKDAVPGPVLLTARATDVHGTVGVSAPVRLTVAPNAPPHFTLAAEVISSDEDQGPVSVDRWGDDISAGPWYEAGQTLRFIVTCDNLGLFASLPSIDVAGTLRYTTAPDAHGETTVMVTLKDNGGTAYGGVDTSAPQTFKIFVSNRNDCPVASPLAVTVDQDSSVAFQLPASDPDGDTLQYEITVAPAHGTLVLGVQTGAASYAPDRGYCGPDSFKFRVKDGGCNSAEVPVSITVNRLNEPPQCEAKIWPAACDLTFAGQNGHYALALDGERACLILSGSGSDPDGDPLQFSWTWDGAHSAAGTWLTNGCDLGCHTATLTVSDGRATCSSVVQFCVITAGEAVEQCIALVNGASLDQKNKRPLIASLKAAGASFDRGSEASAVNQLKAFQNKVRAQIARRWPAEAATFIRCTQNILEAVDCAATPHGN